MPRCPSIDTLLYRLDCQNVISVISLSVKYLHKQLKKVTDFVIFVYITKVAYFSLGNCLTHTRWVGGRITFKSTD